MCGGENWLLIVLVLSVKKVAKSSAVIEVVEGGAGTEERIKCSEEITHVWSAVILLWKCEDLAVWTSVEKDEAKTDTYSGLTDRLIAPFSLCRSEFGPMLTKNIG